MGYESLLSEIDDELLCSICTMVPENPMVSPCDHIFCSDCIEEWLKVKATCPVDSRSLALDDIKPVPRYVRNILDKVKIKCTFEPVGCQTIVPLEQLQHHLTECVFNPNAEVTCEKGCNMKMTRGEYVAANCLEHLANRIQEHCNKITTRQEEEIRKLSNEVDRQREELIGVRCQATHSESLISRQQEDITKLFEEIGQLREDLRKMTVEFNTQRQEITNLKDKVRFSATVPQRQQEEITKLHDNVGRQREANEKTGVQRNTTFIWRIFKNMKNPIGQPQILKYDGNGGNAFAKTLCSLEPSSYCFKIKVLSASAHGNTMIGLTPKSHLTDLFPGYIDNSIVYCQLGYLYFGGQILLYAIEKEWENGDIIECGIKFPDNFTNDGKTNVEVYFAINGQVVGQKVMVMPIDGLFPTVYMEGIYGESTKVEFLNFSEFNCDSVDIYFDSVQ